MIDRTFALIKSAALHRHQGSQIQGRIIAGGFRIIRSLAVFGTPIFETLYAEHEGKPFYAGLIESVSDGSIAMVLEREDAVAEWRRLMGPTDPAKARDQCPDSIRACYGTAIPDNAVHGSDSQQSADREIALFFGPELVLLKDWF